MVLKTIHFEGMPGTGKSTAAESLTRLLVNRSIDARWWLEEDREHPIMPATRRARSRSLPPADYVNELLSAWRHFVATPPNDVVVLDGYALQSTVRFLFAQCAAHTDIVRYFDEWQATECEVSMVYWFVDDVDAHFERLLSERGDHWGSKVMSWTERTPWGQRYGATDLQGMQAFFRAYQSLCLELIESASISIALKPARSWDDDALLAIAQGAGVIETS